MLHWTRVHIHTASDVQYTQQDRLKWTPIHNYHHHHVVRFCNVLAFCCLSMTPLHVYQHTFCVEAYQPTNPITEKQKVGLKMSLPSPECCLVKPDLCTTAVVWLLKGPSVKELFTWARQLSCRLFLLSFDRRPLPWLDHTSFLFFSLFPPSLSFSVVDWALKTQVPSFSCKLQTELTRPEIHLWFQVSNSFAVEMILIRKQGSPPRNPLKLRIKHVDSWD